MIVREPTSPTSAVDGPELLRRMIDRTTPPLDRAAHWWGEVAALASRRRGPGPWSAQVRQHGFLDRYRPQAAEAARHDLLRRAVGELARAVLDANLGHGLSALTHVNLGGRAVVSSLLHRAADIVRVDEAELATDPELTRLVTVLLDDRAAQQTLMSGKLLNEIVNPAPLDIVNVLREPVDDQKRPDGPFGGRYLRWRTRDYDVPRGKIYDLIAHMWNLDVADYRDLMTGSVWDGSVEDHTVCTLVGRARPVLKGIGIPWSLRTNALARRITKVAAHIAPPASDESQ